MTLYIYTVQFIASPSTLIVQDNSQICNIAYRNNWCDIQNVRSPAVTV